VNIRQILRASSCYSVLLASSFAFAAPAPTPPCEACHGANGEGMAAAHVPRIAGQSAEYLQKQLDDYAQGTRDNPVMQNFSKQLSADQRRQFSRHFSSLPVPHGAPGTLLNQVQLARGHQLAFQGDEQRRVQACNGCHGPDGIGVLHAAPYLAGQSAEYLASALRAYQQDTRRNDAGELMRSIARRLNDADVVAVSGYFATVTIPSQRIVDKGAPMSTPVPAAK
jgi:cytochrome c553